MSVQKDIDDRGRKLTLEDFPSCYGFSRDEKGAVEHEVCVVHELLMNHFPTLSHTYSLT